VERFGFPPLDLVPRPISPAKAGGEVRAEPLLVPPSALWAGEVAERSEVGGGFCTGAPYRVNLSGAPPVASQVQPTPLISEVPAMVELLMMSDEHIEQEIEEEEPLDS
jgi:hypothetical protein